MPDLTYFTAAGQASFTAETRMGDYVATPALGAQEPSALLITAPYMQVRANYSRPADNAPLAYSAARANYILQSNAFTTSPWATSGSVSYSAGAATAPDGGSAWALADTSASFAYFYQAVTVANNSATYTFSCRVKRNNGVTGQLTLAFLGGSNVNCSCSFDWSTGVATRLGSSSGSVASVSLGDGWYQVSVTLANDTSGNTSLYCQLYPESSSAAGQSTGYFYGAQLEIAAAATAYIPTTSGGVTVPAVTAYFVNDVNFRTVRGPLIEWERQWATVPASWQEPEDYAYTYPAFSGNAAGAGYNITAISVSGANFVLTTSTTGIATADPVFIATKFTRGGLVSATAFYTLALNVTNTTVTIGSSTFASLGAGSFTNVSGTIAIAQAARAAPRTIPVASTILHDYALTNTSALATDLPLLPVFTPIDLTTGAETSELTTSSTPSSAEYAALVVNNVPVCAECSRRRYLGNIYERATRYVPAR